MTLLFCFQKETNRYEKRIDVLAQPESYHNLSTFSTVEELNKAIRVYRDVIKTSIKRTDVQSKLITLLEILKRHSCKYAGVSFLCKNRIAEIMGVSYKTVQRLMTKLVTLRMIKQIAMKRKKICVKLLMQLLSNQS